MSSRLDKPVFTSFTAGPHSPHRGASSVVYKAVCTEAVRVIFSLHALSQPSVSEVADALRHCRAVVSEPWHSPSHVLDLLAPQHRLGGASPFLPAHSRDVADVGSHVRQSREVMHVLSSTEARECIAHASLYGLLTAAHLLRCSTWTAASLALGPWGETQLSLPLARARAAEELRTREPAWCATVLVQLTEWLLISGKPHFPSALLSRALSLEEVERAAVDGGNASLRSTSPPDDNDDDVRDISVFVTHPRAIFAADLLPLYFPLLANETEKGSQVSPSSSWPPPSSSVAHENGCAHRWLMEDLPRWCVRVALEAQGRVWRRTSLLRRALEQWRARRGLRVIARLSHAAVSSPASEPPLSALTADSLSSVSSSAVSPYSGTPQAAERAPSLRSRITDASEAVALLQTVTTQRAAVTPRSSKVDCQDRSEPLTSSFREVLAANISTIGLDTAPPPPAQSQSSQPTNLPAAVVLAPADHVDAYASASKAHLLDSVLRGERRIRGAPAPRPSLDENPSGGSKAYDPPQRQQECSPRQGRSDAEGSVVVSVPSSTPSSKSSPSSERRRTHASPHLTSSAALAFAGREAHEEELARAMMRRRERAIVQKVFIHWRDRRLYESLAARFIQAHRREVARARCWAQWKRRRAAILQRNKEMRDVARCDVYTEQKALMYFRALLHRWKMTALARHFCISTLGHRVLRAWQCNTRFAQAQRTIQQQLIGDRRVKRYAWTRWRERLQESVADRYRSHKHGAATLLLMRGACVRRQAYRVARSQLNAVILRRVLQRWAQQCIVAARLRDFIKSRIPHHTLTRQAWSTWRSRWLQQQLRQSHERRLRAFRVTHLAGVCFARWVQRWRRETHIQACVARQQHRYLLRTVFLKWHERWQVCLIVRQAQEELALKASEQLEGRRVLRAWRRRAARHAAGRRRVCEALMDANAESLVRRSRLAHTFYHWRTRSFLLQRYNVDRRRCLPAAAAHGAAVARSVITHRDWWTITGTTGTTCYLEADRDDDSESLTGSAAVAPLPLTPRAAASASEPPRRLPQGRVDYARRVSSARSLQKSSARCSNATVVRQSAPVAVAALTEPESTRRNGRAKEDRAAAPAASQGGSRTAQCRNLSVPLRKHALALQRQLLAVKLKRPSLFGTNASVRVPSTGRRPTPPARPLLFEHQSFHTRAARRTTRPRKPPPESTVDQHWGSYLSGSDAGMEAPWRSCTATPLFSAREAVLPLPSPCSAALVESPPSSPSPPAGRPHSGDDLRGSGACAALGSGSARSIRTNRLFGKMEQLLQRIRSIEDGYPATATAATE
ncbi:hypothetical protein LSCM1_02195 [Leishmania martiniquensis]|uniref:Uncharacterized protein n=1 Tax=Leishmania martiniquensis TaxID=1580590 RepID=A0A836KJQ4_9TRYP|nr:hypothetical protein LSCM1_02195 [Leishmania martiniquensis]